MTSSDFRNEKENPQYLGHYSGLSGLFRDVSTVVSRTANIHKDDLTTMSVTGTWYAGLSRIFSHNSQQMQSDKVCLPLARRLV